MTPNNYYGIREGMVTFTIYSAGNNFLQKHGPLIGISLTRKDKTTICYDFMNKIKNVLIVWSKKC